MMPILPIPKSVQSEAFIRRFGRKLICNESMRDCIEWAGTRMDRGAGYGIVRIFGRAYLAHRLAYAIAHGDTPTTSLVCHTCDNPPCCNPDHLFLGTHLDNSLDCLSKGRNHAARGESHYCHLHPEVMPRGEENGFSYLTVSDVIRIRKLAASGVTYKDIGKIVGTTPYNVQSIVYRKTWRHVA